MWRRGIFFGSLVAVVLTGVLQAQEPTQPARSTSAGSARDLIGAPEGEPLEGEMLERLTDEVTALMRCPVCQGLSVADSPTPSALAMRDEARDLLALGYSEDQVLSYFERSYGEFIRLSPKPVGFNLVVWILPVVAIALGALVVWWRTRGRSGRDRLVAEDAPSETLPSDLEAYAERVRKEVNR